MRRWGTVFVLFAILLSRMVSDAWAEEPAEAIVYTDRAIIAYEERRYADALEELWEALRLDPDNVEALYYQGLVSIALDRSDDAQDALEKARALDPTDVDVAFQLGVFLFNQQQYEKADPLFREVLRAQPQYPNLGYYLGVIEYRQQHYQEALGFLRANVPSDATFNQLARFYIGLAMSASGSLAEARAEVEEIIRIQPLSPLVTSAQRFRELLEPTYKGARRFEGELRLGYFYDDNVAVVPSASADIVAQDLRARKHRSDGELGSLRLAYTWLQTADWEATASYTFSQTWNNHLSNFNIQSHTGSIGGTYRNTVNRMPFFAGIEVADAFVSLDNPTHKFVNVVSAQPFFSLAENFSHLTSLFVRFQHKDFDDQGIPPEEVRDARNYMAGFTHTIRFAEDRHFIRLGYQFDVDDAEGRNWSYQGHRALVGAQYTISEWGVRLRYDFDLHWRFYWHPNSLLPVDRPNTVRRRDFEPRHLVSVAKDLPYNMVVLVDFLLDDNNSRLDAFNYDRQVVSVSLAWRF
ncbi:tetratricopeptide repeat protein [Candidatus Methylomirabilis sp.]|uniref:tetratricopeptide repeat protein n=1 Tax=Candidatus Methylomirabilis sp. TaxID=2032687 RepID=UPI002A6977F7|nr:tetratricopeptide repeat protein [Candidatus Methylomirabilis sp.]